ncbi:hypothetical protein EDD16DRAFT_1722901 [Pisolithus croceorrhizus]|nr:hypothetical protein EDD16DRAFT_1722901 [Pisolithus croceorrhizus]
MVGLIHPCNPRPLLYPHPIARVLATSSPYLSSLVIMTIPGGFGSTLIGGLISAMLYGIATLQTYVYYTHYSDDALAIRFLVTGIWILDTLRFLFVCHFLYYYLITNYGIPTSLLYMVWSLPASILVHVRSLHFKLSTTRISNVTGNYGYRSSMLLRAPNILPLSPRSEVVGDCSHYVISIGWDRFIDSETSLGPQISFYTGIPTLTVYVLAEILITVSLCTLFYDNGSRSTFPRMKRLLNMLILCAVNRCLLTLLVTIAELAAEVNHQNAWTIAFDFIGQGLYSNSLLASLNARQYLRSQASSTVTDLRISAVDFAKLEGHVESSEDGTGRFRVWQEAHTDIAADPSLGKIMA